VEYINLTAGELLIKCLEELKAERDRFWSTHELPQAGTQDAAAPLQSRGAPQSAGSSCAREESAKMLDFLLEVQPVTGLLQ
jgi:hypothetical protein